MRRILEDVWGIHLKIVTREFTLVGVNPALDAFTDMADHIRTEAEQQARENGRALAFRPRAA
jgi:FMN-dependent NADH-azoreductase